MSNRRENIKKSLGITEYPWSSDDDDDNPPITQSVPDMSFHQRSSNQRSSSGPMPGTSGQSFSPSYRFVPPPLPPPPTPASGSSTRPSTSSERDLFWSIINNNPRTTTTIHRSRMSSDMHTPASELREAAVDRSSSAADMQCIMAIKKLTRTLNQRPKTAVNVMMPRRATSSPVRHLLSHANANELLAKIRANQDKIKASRRSQDAEATNTAGIVSLTNSHLIMRRPNRSPDQEDHDQDEQQPSTSGQSRPVPAHDLDRVDAPVPSANVNVDHSDDAESNHSVAEVSLEEIVEIDAQPSGSHDGNQNTDVQQPSGSAETAANTITPDEQPHGVKRKHNDEPAETTIKEFNQSLLRLLECPVCMEWLEPPMSQCRRGHLVCARCRARLSACPVCRTPFSSVRNRAMEAVAEMLRYPCRHGCGCELRLRRRGAHEASCAARMYACLAPACVARPQPLPALQAHTRTKHQTMTKIGRKHKFSMKVNAEHHSAWFVLAFQELFHLRVDVDIRTWGIVIYVAYVGPKCNSKKFTYEVSVAGQHNSRQLAYTRTTHSDLELTTLNVSRQDCFHLTLDQAMNFLRLKNRQSVPDKCLDFYVEIGKCEVDPRDDSDS